VNRRVTRLASRPRGNPSIALAALSLTVASPGAFAGACKLVRIAEFPITMTNLQPLMTAKINDTDVRFVVDSGAFYSVISPASAAELKLSTSLAPFGFYMSGVGGGKADVSIAKVKVFTLAGVSVPNVSFLVGGSQIGEGSIGVLGQNVLHLGDTEYDLGQGFVRLWRPEGCGKAILAYWIGAGGAYSLQTIQPTTPQHPHTMGWAFVNGSEIRVTFDTGAANSILSLNAAARIGIKPDSPGVVFAGASSGFGANTMATYIAPVSSFKIGDEEIRNTRLRIGDIDLPNSDMLIGADFFLSHRVYVANSQHQLYFTYNGGPVFNLTAVKHAAAAPVADAAADESKAAGESKAPAESQAADQPAQASRNPDEAADYARRGAALASRRQFDQAIADLTRACELAPDNPDYFYERGMAYWENRQSGPAWWDFDQALRLKPDDLPALVVRAELLLQKGDKVRAAADLDAADAVASKQADERYVMGQAYEAADQLGRAVAQYDLWITAHDVDARLPEALNLRCWARALAGVDLNLALKDCNAALKRAAKSSPFYAQVADSRGLVLLRQGEYDKSIADYDASLKINPKDAWSLYGRGIDKLREHKTLEGDADLTRAESLWPAVGDEFKRHGMSP
jgi:tetratricopeptide (TPR) repeat protein/predicted aspartyl protease